MAGKSQYKYKPEYSIDILEYGKQGLSCAQVASKFGVNRKTVYDWAHDPVQYPEFVAAYLQYETEKEAHHNSILLKIASGELKVTNGAVGALIYLHRVQFGHKYAEYLIDQKREIKTEAVPARETVKEEIKRILNVARDAKADGTGTGESDPGTTAEAV